MPTTRSAPTTGAGDDRKKALEAKKAKLAQMRAEKERRLQEKKKVEQEKSQQTQQTVKEKLEIDDQVQNIIKEQNNLTTNSTETKASMQTPQAPNSNTSQSQQSLGSQPPRALPTLSKSSISHYELTPKEIISYAKETQTAIIATDCDDLAENTESEEKKQHQQNTSPEAQTGENSEKNETSDQSNDKNEIPTEESPPETTKEFTQDELEQIHKSDQFWQFLDKATRVVERALTETQVDIFTDYQADGADQDLLDPLNGEALSSSRVFCDEAWTKNRIVSAVEWSTVHPELIYTAYGAKQAGSLHDPEGVVCVWNTKYKKDTPEFVFHCPSPITSLTLSPYSPNLTIGGTYSGQIVVWDNRSRKRTPVQRSKHIAKSHTHPIYCLDLVGSKNSHNLISVSSDGRVCSWSLDMLAQPQEPPFDLTHPSDKRRSISVMSSSFPRANTNQFLIGCEDGGVYQAQRHGNKSGITDMFGYGGVGGSMASSTEN